MFTEKQIMNMSSFDDIPEGAVLCRVYHGDDGDVIHLWKYCPNGVCHPKYDYIDYYKNFVDMLGSVPHSIQLWWYNLTNMCSKNYYTVTIFEDELEAKMKYPELFI